MPPYQRGTGFVGLNQYLGLNRGAAGQMGNALAQQAEQQGAAAQGAIDTATSKANEAVKAGGTGQGYSGPTGLGDMATLYGQAAGAQNYANALGNNAGRATLLGQQYGANTWGGGQLDAALAGAGAGGQRMAAAQGKYGKLLEYLGNAQQGVQQRAADARTAAPAPTKRPPGQVERGDDYRAFRPGESLEPAELNQRSTAARVRSRRDNKYP